ncbi:MAG: sulfur carrier protein ThiS [Deltaproteobacteria bacterium]|nr:sulfur carrier protein ThiS [Deltaproteobacteria bacterium]
MTEPIEILLNGQPHTLDSPLSLAALMTQLKIEAKHVAIAKNDEIITRSLLQETFAQNGDRIEMITAVQGG